MPRKPQNDAPMDTVTRRAKSDAEKRARGEMRITTWISPEAKDALTMLMKLGGGSIQEVLCAALIGLAAANEPAKRKKKADE